LDLNLRATKVTGDIHMRGQTSLAYLGWYVQGWANPISPPYHRLASSPKSCIPSACNLVLTKINKLTFIQIYIFYLEYKQKLFTSF